MQNEGTPALSASSAVLYEVNSDAFLYARADHTRRPIASTTKIMTALVALENAPLDRIVTVPASAVGVEGSSLYLKKGERLTVEQLLYGLLLQSANDAAVALAVTVSGSVDAFADLMNRRAESLGLTDTHFTNPHGLDNPEHYSSAYDLAMIAAEAMQNDTFRKIVGTKKYTLPSPDGKGVRVLVNHNKLLRLSPDAVGIKTGFTKKSGRCLVSAAEREGILLIAVTLNASDDWNDHQALFRYGFDSVEVRTLAEPGEIRYTLPVVNGESETVLCVNREQIRITLPKSSPAPEPEIRLGHFTAAPVREGAVLGSIVYRLGDRIVASCPLVAASDIGEIQYKKGLF